MADPLTNPNWFVRRWFSRVRRMWNGQLKPRAPFMRYVEFGSYCGDSLLWAAENLLGPGGTAWGVDPWNGDIGVTPKRKDRLWPERLRLAHERCVERCEQFNAANQSKRCYAIRQTSQQFLAEAFGHTKFDIIYVDACHFAPEALTDIAMSWLVLQDGGILVVDDLFMGNNKKRRQPHVWQAWQAFKTCYAGRYEMVYENEYQGAVLKLPEQPRG